MRLLCYLLIKNQTAALIDKIVPRVKFYPWNCLLSKALKKSFFVFIISKSRKVTEEGYTNSLNERYTLDKYSL